MGKKENRSIDPLIRMLVKRISTSCISCMNILVNRMGNEWNACYEVAHLLPNGCDFHSAFQPFVLKNPVRNRKGTEMSWRSSCLKTLLMLKILKSCFQMVDVLTLIIMNTCKLKLTKTSLGGFFIRHLTFIKSTSPDSASSRLWWCALIRFEWQGTRWHKQTIPKLSSPSHSNVAKSRLAQASTWHHLFPSEPRPHHRENKNIQKSLMRTNLKWKCCVHVGPCHSQQEAT